MIMDVNNNDNDVDPNHHNTTTTAAINSLSTPPPPSRNNSSNDNDDDIINCCHRTTSEGSSGIQSSSLGATGSVSVSGIGSALSSPLLNGEHIVLLSLSNDNTPIDHTPPPPPADDDMKHHDDNNNGGINDDDCCDEQKLEVSTPPVVGNANGLRNKNNIGITAAASERERRRSRSGFEVIERRDNLNLLSSSTEISISPAASVDDLDDDEDNIGNIFIHEELLSNTNNSNNGVAYSPPPDSIINSDLQSLSHYDATCKEFFGEVIEVEEAKITLDFHWDRQ